MTDTEVHPWESVVQKSIQWSLQVVKICYINFRKEWIITKEF